MTGHSSPRSANVNSRTAKILSIALVVSLLLGLVLLRSGNAQSLPAMKLEPKYVAVKAGEKFDVQIRVYGATYPNSEVSAWQVRIEFPIASLEAMPSPAYGNFMSLPRIGYWGLLLYNAPAGQNVVNVTEGSRFIIGQQVLITDDLHSENKTISNIQGSKITLNANLVNSYTVAANAGCYPYPTLSAIGSISNSLGSGTFGQTTNGVNPGAQGDGLLATLSFYAEQDVSSHLNITSTLTYIKTTLGEVVGDEPGELEKQDSYTIRAEDINANGVISGTDLFLLGKDFNKCPIQTRSPTATSSPGTAWTSPENAYKPDNLAASAATPAGKIQDYKTFGFPTTVWTGVTKVEVGLFARIGSGGDDQIKIEVSNNGGTSWSLVTGTVSPTTTATWTMYWVDLTTAYGWTPAGVASIAVRITSVMVGPAMATVYVDWVTVRVTPSPGASSGYSDVNRNGIVTGADLTLLAGQFGQQYGT
jgi:hypothetical protein